MGKTLQEELDDIEGGDELPLSNRVFARFMRHLCSNHLAHMTAEIKTLKLIIFTIMLPLLILILAAMAGMVFTK